MHLRGESILRYRYMCKPWDRMRLGWLPDGKFYDNRHIHGSSGLSDSPKIGGLLREQLRERSSCRLDLQRWITICRLRLRCGRPGR